MPQIAQFDKSINLFCLVFLTLEFSLAWYFLQLTQQVSIVFIEANPLWLVYESIKALEIRTSIVFNLSFPNNTILSCFLLIFPYNWLILFSSCSDCTNFYSYCRTRNTNRNKTNEPNAETETQPVTIEARINKFSTQF